MEWESPAFSRGFFLRTLLGKRDHIGGSGEPLRRQLHVAICVADKAADRAVGVADWYVNLAALEADREVLRRRLRKAQLLNLFGVLELRSEGHGVEGSFLFGRSRFPLLGEL
jgi:hypothetical protein